MNKIVYVAFLALICLSNCKTPGQDIIQGVFDVFSIKSQIDENCFSERFVEMVSQLVENQNIPHSEFVVFGMMFYEVMRNCPINDFMLHIGSLVQKKINDKTISNNFIKKIRIAFQIFIDYLNSDNQDANSLGRTLGKCLQTFLLEEEAINEETCEKLKLSIFNIVKGVLTGLSKDYLDTKCRNNVVLHRELITNLFNEWLQFDLPYSYFLKFLSMDKYVQLLDIAGDCRLNKLFVLLYDISKQPWIIMTKLEIIESELKYLERRLYYEFKNEEDFSIGYILGAFFKAVFDFYVD